MTTRGNPQTGTILQTQHTTETTRVVVVSPQDAPIRLKRVDLSDAARRLLTTSGTKLEAASTQRKG